MSAFKDRATIGLWMVPLGLPNYDDQGKCGVSWSPVEDHVGLGISTRESIQEFQNTKRVT